MTPPRPRARDLGIAFDGTPGRRNALTDVPGVQVGYTTLIRGTGPLRTGHGPVRTGVTAILPYGREGAGRVAVAGWHALNGNGEMTGTAWIEESGGLALPVLITNTHAVGACHQGVIDWVARTKPGIAGQWLLPVIAETWDGYLNDINGLHVTPGHAIAAIDSAAGGPVAEGSVGGGTGMTCYGFKGGSGTASRTVSHGPDQYTVGAFVQANFGQRDELRIAGLPAGPLFSDDNPEEDNASWLAPPGAGSVIVVLATDAPLLPGQAKALARRAPIGLARTGTAGSHFSGDIFLAFSTANPNALASTFPVPSRDDGYRQIRFLPWGHIDPFYTAAVQATEEAVINCLVAADTMTGRDDHRSPALPVHRLAELLTHTAQIPAAART